MPKRSASINIMDVANLANVSKKTVSRVINNQSEISPDTRQRVLDAIKQLDYRPNRLARGLSAGNSHTIGIVIPNISDPFFPGLILGAESVAIQRDYTIFLCNYSADPAVELKYVDLLLQHQVDGLMLVGSRLDKVNLSLVAKDRKVAILSPYEVPGAAQFYLDDFGGGYRAGKHLISLGHRHLRYLGSSWARPDANLRYEGFRQALSEAGLPTQNCYLSPVQITTNLTENFERTRQVVKEFLANDSTTTALFCYNDVLALGALLTCVECGKRVPEELSVIGFDNISESSRSFPPLTTMSINRYEVGQIMMETLFKMIDDSGYVPERQMILPVLVERASCASPKTL